MFCEHCGSDTSDNAAFCQRCGKKLDQRLDHQTVVESSRGESRKIGSSLVEAPDGSLSWAYEVSFWKNPTILITVSKVMLLALAFPTLLAFVLGLEDGIAEAGEFALTMLAIGGAIVAVLLVAAYVLVGLAYGGRYQVLFKMDDRGVHHIQLKKQYDRAVAMNFLTALAGLAGGNLSAAGAGLMGASRQSMYTEFSSVRSVKVKEARNVIYVNGTLSRNQVYAASGDLPKVRDFILSHCPPGTRVR